MKKARNSNVSPHVVPHLSVTNTLKFYSFSAFVVNEHDGTFEAGGDSLNLKTAMEWAASRSDSVTVRWIDGSITSLKAGENPWVEWTSRSRATKATNNFSICDSGRNEIEAEAASLREMRLRAGLTIPQLSVLSGVPDRVIQGIEECKPPYIGELDVWARIVKALNADAKGLGLEGVGWVVREGSMLLTAMRLYGVEPRNYEGYLP